MVEETWMEISWVKRKVYECLKKSGEWEKLTKNISIEPYSFKSLSANHSQISCMNLLFSI